MEVYEFWWQVQGVIYVNYLWCPKLRKSPYAAYRPSEGHRPRNTGQ